MKTQAVRLYGANDPRLEEFELPEIKDDEILVKVITDSICMSTYKAVIQGTKHKRVPDDISEHPVILGHEFSGDIVAVGKKWQDEYRPGEKFALQPTLNYKGTLWAPGYSFEYYGGACTYCILPHQAIELGCLLHYNAPSYFEASLGEPMSCIIGAFHSNYHTNRQNYEHAMGPKRAGNLLILGGCGPMGMGAIEYAINMNDGPSRVVVTDIDDEKLERASTLISKESASIKGVELIYVNTAKTKDPEAELQKLVEGKGYDDVFVFVPVKSVAEMANRLLAFDGCMNMFAGPVDPNFKAEVNLYDAHYTSAHIMGASGGIASDMQEAVEMIEQKKLRPASMVTHIGGLDSYAETVSNLPKIPGGGKTDLYADIHAAYGNRRL